MIYQFIFNICIYTRTYLYRSNDAISVEEFRNLNSVTLRYNLSLNIGSKDTYFIFISNKILKKINVKLKEKKNHCVDKDSVEKASLVVSVSKFMVTYQDKLKNMLTVA